MPYAYLFPCGQTIYLYILLYNARACEILPQGCFFCIEGEEKQEACHKTGRMTLADHPPLLICRVSPALPPRVEGEDPWGRDLLLLETNTSGVVSLAVSYDDDAVVLHELAILHAVGSDALNTGGNVTYGELELSALIDV